jgi:ferredoxin
VRVRVDPAACQGHGQCALICPEVFGADEQGFAVVGSADVPAALAEAVRRAELQCPERAIQIDRGDRGDRGGDPR